MPELHQYYPSVTVNQLQANGIVPIAQVVAEGVVPLADRLIHCLDNWKRVSQDQWVSDTIQGYKVPFISRPYQPYPPCQLVLSQEGEELTTEEIKETVEKNAIQEASLRGRGFVSNVFLVPKKDRGQKPMINLKKLDNISAVTYVNRRGGTPRMSLKAADWSSETVLKKFYYKPTRNATFGHAVLATKNQIEATNDHSCSEI